jgi:hypothetical protein
VRRSSAALPPSSRTLEDGGGSSDGTETSSSPTRSLRWHGSQVLLRRSSPRCLDPLDGPKPGGVRANAFWMGRSWMPMEFHVVLIMHGGARCRQRHTLDGAELDARRVTGDASSLSSLSWCLPVFPSSGGVAP